MASPIYGNARIHHYKPPIFTDGPNAARLIGKFVFLEYIAGGMDGIHPATQFDNSFYSFAIFPRYVTWKH